MQQRDAEIARLATDLRRCQAQLLRLQVCYRIFINFTNSLHELMEMMQIKNL